MPIEVKQRMTETTSSKHSCVGSARSLVSITVGVVSLLSAIRWFATNLIFGDLVVFVTD